MIFGCCCCQIATYPGSTDQFTLGDWTEEEDPYRLVGSGILKILRTAPFAGQSLSVTFDAIADGDEMTLYICEASDYSGGLYMDVVASGGAYLIDLNGTPFSQDTFVTGETITLTLCFSAERGVLDTNWAGVFVEGIDPAGLGNYASIDASDGAVTYVDYHSTKQPSCPKCQCHCTELYEPVLGETPFSVEIAGVVSGNQVYCCGCEDAINGTKTVIGVSASEGCCCAGDDEGGSHLDYSPCVADSCEEDEHCRKYKDFLDCANGCDTDECLESCDTSGALTCLRICDENYAACVAACMGDADCEAACLAAKFTCQGACPRCDCDPTHCYLHDCNENTSISICYDLGADQTTITTTYGTNCSGSPSIGASLVTWVGVISGRLTASNIAANLAAMHPTLVSWDSNICDFSSATATLSFTMSMRAAETRKPKIAPSKCRPCMKRRGRLS
jgi:hypothetical protein